LDDWLLYEGFGHFLDIINGRDDVPGLDEIDAPKLESAVTVDELAKWMSTYFAADGCGIPCLTCIFSPRTSRFPSFYAATIGSGYNTTPPGPASMVLEFIFVGYYITFYAFIVIDHCVRLIALTPTLSYIRTAS
jgi:hypothetical protein